MKKKLLMLLVITMLCGAGLFLFTGCGSSTGQNLEDYMKDQTSQRANTDAELSIISGDAKATVKYTPDNVAEVTVKYYALTNKEIKAIEPGKAAIRSKTIMKPVLENFEKDTGNRGEVVVIVEGKTAEQ